MEQFYALLDEVPVSGAWGSGRASVWAERLSAKAPDTQVLLRYGSSNGWLDGHPAVLQRRIGKGRLTYVGALLDESLMRAAVRRMVDESGVQPALGPVPTGVEVCRRAGRGREVFVLINHATRPVSVDLPGPMRDVLSGEALLRRIALPVQGVAVLAAAPGEP